MSGKSKEIKGKGGGGRGTFQKDSPLERGGGTWSGVMLWKGGSGGGKKEAAKWKVPKTNLEGAEKSRPRNPVNELKKSGKIGGEKRKTEKRRKRGSRK